MATERRAVRGLAWLGALRGWRGLLAYAALGGLAALGHAPFDIWPLTVLALGAAIGAFAVAPGGRWWAFGRGWALGLGYFAVGWNWLVEPFLVQPEIFGWMAPFALALLSGAMALYWAGAGLIAHVIGGAAPWRRMAALAGAIALAETFRGTWFTGFPWGMVAYVWIETPLSQALAWIGPHGLTLATLLAAGGAGTALATGRGWLWPGVVVVAGALAALVLAPGAAPGPDPDAPVVRLVQSGAEQAEKWLPGNAQRFLDLQLGYTGAGDPPDLAIWSETAVPYLLRDAGPVLSAISAATRGGTAIAGIQRYADGSYFNSMVAVDPAGTVTDTYDKMHLVPYGEYLPFENLMRALGLRGLAANIDAGFRPGAARAPIEVPGIGPVWPIICYESIFPAEVGDWQARPRLIVLITNDAWFGRFSGPYQHLAQGRARAIEQGVPMVRVAQTGVSAMIDARGRVTASIPLGTAGWVDAALPPERPATAYARSGDWPALAAIWALLLGVAALRVARRGIDPARGAA